ncbi:2316_t:CDS:2 [Paraglomus brasilianum]|uniref:2316_t:CDS:1 n=1 Tax=Paraglomus brasilianum TaxID=144538 RepID=A0A9N9EVT5_9GLOM|nr:2316_t:CDS:2 [Paraglomus brasilianum]
MASIAKELLKQSSKTIPIIRSARAKKNLYELLNVYPNYGVGLLVVRRWMVPDKWVGKGFKDCYYKVTRVRLKPLNIKHGRAFGIQYWNGEPINNKREVVIRGDLKWGWMIWPSGDKEGRWA